MFISLHNGCAQIAQSVEQRTENPRVDGSIPSLGTICFFIFCIYISITYSIYYGYTCGVIFLPNRELPHNYPTTFFKLPHKFIILTYYCKIYCNYEIIRIVKH